MKVAILGTAPSRGAAPFDDPDWKIWACSPGNMNLPSWDEFFEVHYDMATRPGEEAFCAWLRQQAETKTVWMTDPTGFPGAMKFCHEPLIKIFGRNFFGEETGGSSVAWMVAEALRRYHPTFGGPGLEAIGFWGVEMATASEYWTQRSGVHHFIDVASALGVAIEIPQGCALLKTQRLYGVEPPSAEEAELRKRIDTLTQMKDEASAKARKHEQEALAFAGGIAALRETLRLHYGVRT